MKSKTKSQTFPSRIEAVVKFLPVFEAIAPDDFAQLVGTTEVPGEIPLWATSSTILRFTNLWMPATTMEWCCRSIGVRGPTRRADT